MIVINSRIRIPDEELDFSYVRSSGPGGQNVNKVSSKAVLRFNVRSSPSLPEGVRQRFVERFGGRLTNDGEVIITSQRYRDQGKNNEDCQEKLREMLLVAATPPKPRKKTKPSLSSKRKRLEEKKQTSGKKAQRRQRFSLD